MSQARSFHCPSASFPALVTDAQDWLTEQGFRCQKLPMEDGGTLIQIEKPALWRKAVGMSTALNIVFHQADDTTNVELGAGRWIDKAAAGAVAWFLFWPAAVTAGIGIWQQTKMPQRVFEFIDGAAQLRSLDPVRETVDRQLKLPKDKRDMSSLEQILATCDTRLGDPKLDDFGSCAITYYRACALRLLGKAEQAKDDLLHLGLIEQERKKTATGGGVKAELLKRVQREHPKTMAELTILGDIYRLLAELSMEEERYDAAMVFFLRASQVGDSETERKSRDAAQNVREQYAGVLHEQRPDRRQILFCTNEIPSWTPEGFCFASADTLRGAAWQFEVSHPQPDLFYVCHPLRPDRYYELEGFHDRVFDDKKDELVHLLGAIGATYVHMEAFRRSVQERSVTAVRAEDAGGSKFGVGASSAVSDEREVSERRQRTLSETEEWHLQPVAAPHIPDDLVWYPHEPKWKNIAQGALAGRLKQVTVRMEYHEDFSINARRVEQIAAGLEFFSHRTGVHWSKETEERLQQRKDTIWEFTASFADQT